MGKAAKGLGDMLAEIMGIVLEHEVEMEKRPMGILSPESKADQ